MVPALVNNVALVTGASSGIGKQIAKLLYANGASVVLAARRTAPLESLATELKSSSSSTTQFAVPLAMDVSNPESINSALKSISKNVNILVNNAGIGLDTPIRKSTLSDFDAVLNTNFRGPWYLSQQIAAQMNPECANNTIINIGSIAGLSPGAHSSNLSIYGASKAALHHMTASMAVEFAHKKAGSVRVNAIAPGYIETEINAKFFKANPAALSFIKSKIPQRRIGAVTDLDGIIMLLADASKSSFITGAVIPVDGGHSIATS